MATNSIQFQVGYQVDKSGLKEIESSLQSLKKITTSDYMNLNKSLNTSEAKAELQSLQVTIEQIESALKNAFNADLGTLNISKFNSELKNLDIDKVYSQLSKTGSAGTAAFRSLTSEVLTTNVQLKQSHQFLDNIATTLANTAKWNVASSAMNSLSGAISSAYSYSKSLDSSLNDIRIVTGQSAEQMAAFAESANEAAKSLGSSTTDYTNAALIYYQQGLDEAEAAERADITIKTANVTGQDTQEVSEQLTAVWNGYNVSAEEAELYVDRLAAVAASTASDLEQLATGMSKVASAASAMGVGEEQLAAQLSTIISVTQQDAASVGTALKTIYARMSDIEAGVDEDGATLGSYTGEMAEMGVNVLTTTGELRDMGEVIEEIGNKWADYTREQQVALAQTMAGTRQYNNLIALFDNWDQYEAALETASDAEGTLQEQQDIYMESTEAHLQQLETAWEDVYDSFIDTDAINNLVDSLTLVVNEVANMIDAVGGGSAVIQNLGSVAVGVFSTQIAGGISTFINNLQAAQQNAEALKQQLSTLETWQNSTAQNDAIVKNTTDRIDAMTKYYSTMSAEEINAGNAIVKELAEAENAKAVWEANEEAALQYAQAITEIKTLTLDDLNVNIDTDEYQAIAQAMQRTQSAISNIKIDLQSVNDKTSNLNVSVQEDADAFELMAADIYDMVSGLDQLAQDTNINTTAYEKMQSLMEQLGLDATDATTAVQKMLAVFSSMSQTDGGIEKWNNLLKELNFYMGQVGKTAQKEFDTVNSTMEQMATKTDENATKVDNLTKKWTQFNETAQQKATITSFVQLASAIGNVATILNTATNLWETWNDADLSTNEKMYTSFRNLAFILPTVISLVNNASAAIKGLNTAIGTGATAGVGILIALLGTAATAWSNYQTSQEEALQAMKDDLGDAVEELESLQDESTNIQDLYNDYLTLYATYQQTGEGKDDLKTATTELCSALGIEIDTLDLLASSYDKVNAAISEATYDQAQEALKSAQRTQENAADTLYSTSTEDNVFAKHQVSFKSDTGSALTDEGQLLTQFLQSFLKEAGISEDIVTIDDYGLYLDNIESAEDFVDIYKAIKDTMDYLDDSGILNGAMEDTEIWNNIQDWLTAGEEYYQNYVDAQTAMVEQAKIMANALASMEASDFDISDITSVEDYEAYREQYISALREIFEEQGLAEILGLSEDEIDDYLNDLADDYLHTIDYIQDYVERFDATEELKESISGAQDLIAGWIASLNDEDFEIVVSLDLPDDATLSDVQAMLAAVKEDADTISFDDLLTEYEALHKIIDGLATGDTIDAEDYAALLEAAGDEASIFFTQMLDGTYKLTGDAEDFYNYVQSVEINKALQQGAANTKSIETYNAISTGDIDVSSLASLKETLEEVYNGISSLDFSNMSSDFVEAANSSDALNAELELMLEYYHEFQNGRLNIYDDDIEAWNSLTTLYEHAADQLSLLTDLQAVDSEQLALWNNRLEEGTLTLTNFEEITEAVIAATNDMDISIEELAAENQALDLAIANSATSIDQLRQYLEDGIITVEAFNQVYGQLWDAERTADLDTDELASYTDYLYDLKEAELQAAEAAGELVDVDIDEYMEDYADVAENLATEIMNMNDAIEDLADNFDDWADMLKNSTKESEEYADAISGMRSDLSKLLDIEEDFISADYVLDNLDDIEKAATGDADAIDRLRAAALDTILLDIQVQNGLDDDWVNNFLANISTIWSNLDLFQAALDGYDWTIDPYLEMGDLISGESDFIDMCNALIDEAGLTQDQVTAMFGSMGYDVTFESSQEPETTSVPVYKTVHTVQSTGSQSFSYTDSTGETRTIDVPTWEEYSYTETAGTKEVEGYVTTSSAEYTSGDYSSGGSSTSSHISGISKKASSSANNYSSVNKGGNSSGSGSGSSGGSGSGSGSTEEPDVMDDLESVIDRYHDINIVLEQISTELSRLQKQQSKYFGQTLVDNLNEQLATLDKQIEAYAKKLAIAQDEAQEIQEELALLGVTFASDGTISNYAAILAAKESELQAMIDKYNAMTATEQEAYKDTLDKAQEAYDDFVARISDYDTLISQTIPELEDSITDALDEEIEIKITEFTMEVEIRLDMREAEEDWNEFYRKVVQGIDDDDLLGNAQQNLADYESYFNTNGSGTGSIQTLTTQLNNTMEQIEQIKATGTSDWYGDDYAQALEDLQTYYTELMTELEDLEDLIDDTWEDYYDLIDEATEAFDDHLDRYEALGDILEHDIELVQLLYGDDAYDALNSYYEQAEANYNSELAFLRQRVDYAYQMYQSETDEEAKSKWEEEYLDALDELNSAVEDAAQNIIDKYTNTINQIIDELNDSITNGLGLDYVSEEWDLINQKADIYLDEINAMYETQALKQKYLDAIDETDSIAAQQKLNELMEEQIGYLEEKENLTDYDIERAELLYEIALKQLALEEAQNNTSTMRLRRDSQGNYSYQYVTDEDAVADAQSELLALQNQLYNLDVEEYNNNLNEIYSAYNEFQQKLLALYEDQTLSEEERAAQAALLEEYYGDIINSLVEENAVIRTNLSDSAFSALAAMYATDSELFAAMSGINIEEYENFVSSMSTLDSQALEDFNNMTQTELDWIGSLTDEQLQFLSDLSDEQLEMFRNMTEEELQEYGDLTDAEIELLANMTDEQYSLIEGMTDDQINFLLSLSEAQRAEFTAMTDEEREAFTTLTTSATGDYATMYASMKSYLESLDEDTKNTMINELVPTWTSGVQAMVDTISGSGGLSEVCQDAYDQLEQAVEDYEQEMNEMADAAGIDLTSIAEGYDAVTERVQELITTHDDVIATYSNEIDAIRNVISELEALIAEYEAAREAAIAATQAAYELWQAENQTAAEAASQTTTKASSTTTKKSSSSSGSTTTTTTTTKKDNSSKAEGVAAAIWIEPTAGWGNDPERATKLKEKGVEKAQSIINSQGPNGTLYKNWYGKDLSGYYYGAFDTGGYTGEWSDAEGVDEKGGKFAILHQKELVLNKTDTENLLQAVSLVSDMSGLLDNLNAAVSTNVTGLLDTLGQFKFDFSQDSDTLEQQVSIEATFPNVTNSTEVEDALNNLINAAAQHANKKGI